MREGKLIAIVMILLTFSTILMTNAGASPKVATDTQTIISNGIITNGINFGVVSAPWILTQRDCIEMKDLGVKYLRMDFLWEDFKPVRGGAITFAEYDNFVNMTQKYGLQIIACIWHVPQWLRPTNGNMFTIPTGEEYNAFVTDYGNLVYAIVSHFKNQIKYFEIWNEPNNNVFWNDTEGTVVGSYIYGNATAKYVQLLKEAYTQAKSANPQCEIISGGLAENDYIYFNEMYSDGAKGYFDYLGLHPYFWRNNWDPTFTNTNDPAFDYLPKIQNIRDIMVNNGDSSKSIFITELGLGGNECSNETLQAQRLTQTIKIIMENYPYVPAIMWYQLRDKVPNPLTDPNYGLITYDFTPRLMFKAYQQVIDASQ